MKYLTAAILVLAVCGCESAVVPDPGPPGETWIVQLEFTRKLTAPEVTALLAPLWSADLKPHPSYGPVVATNGATSAMLLVWDVSDRLDVNAFLYRTVSLPGVRSAKCNGITATAP